jgi:TP901 family phage tail tape measure protein
MAAIATLAVNMVAKTAAFERSMKKVHGDVSRLNTGISRISRNLIMMGAGYLSFRGLISGFKATTGEALSFEKGMSKISTMLDGSTMYLLPRYEKKIEELAVKYGQSAETLQAASYDILSAQIAAADGMKVLEISTKSAIGGFTESAITTKAIIKQLKAYDYEASEAARISDIMHASVKRGIMTFEDYASSIGNVLGFSAYLDVELEAVGAAIASMTRSGLSADKAFMALKNILNQFKNPTDAAKKAARELGFELDETSIQGAGLITIIEKLRYANARQLDILMPSMRAIAGFAGMLKNAGNVAEDYNYILNSTGLTQEQFNKRAKDSGFILERANQQMKKFGRDMGKEVVPAYADLANMLVEDKLGLKEFVKDMAGGTAEILSGLESIGVVARHLFTDIDSLAEVQGDARGRAWDRAFKKPVESAGKIVEETKKLIYERTEFEKEIDAFLKKQGGDWGLTADEIEKMTEIQEKLEEAVEMTVNKIEEEARAYKLVADGKAKDIEQAKFQIELQNAFGEGTSEAIELQKRYAKAFDYIFKARNEEKQIIDKTREAVEHLRQTEYLSTNERIQWLKDYAATNAEELEKVAEAHRIINEEIENLDRDRVDRLTAYYKDLEYDMKHFSEYSKGKLTELAMSVEGSLGSAFSTAFQGGENAWQDFMLSIKRAWFDMIGQMVARAMMFSVLGIGKGVMGIGAAKGAVFDSGRVVPMGRGEIITGPTIFPMARGYGLMGEAGPEAVMPLTRTSGGRLGVESTGSGGGQPIININFENKGTPQREVGRQVWFDEVLKQYVINVVTEDASRNGRATQAIHANRRSIR